MIRDKSRNAAVVFFCAAASAVFAQASPAASSCAFADTVSELADCSKGSLRDDLDNTLIPAPVGGWINYDPTAGQPTTGPRVVGATAEQAAEDQIAWEAKGGALSGLGPIAGIAVFVAGVIESGQVGNNIAYSVWQTLYRKFASGPIDQTFSPELFIATHSNVIPTSERWRWMGTTNEVEAQRLLQDHLEHERLADLLDARSGLDGYSR